jgi:hypothetical protein
MSVKMDPELCKSVCPHRSARLAALQYYFIASGGLFINKIFSQKILRLCSPVLLFHHFRRFTFRLVKVFSLPNNL